jgi:Helix-turn-helix domain
LEDLVRLRRARDLMDRDYAKPLDVPALARVALMSPGHFSRSFRAAFGETPYSYLMTRRIERAKALLRRGDLTVTEVCSRSGAHRWGRSARGSPSWSARARAHTGDPVATSGVAGPGSFPGPARSSSTPAGAPSDQEVIVQR